MSQTDLLRLIALDADDLAVVSAHLQDSVVKVADMSWLPAEKRFAMAFNRFAWEAAQKGLFRRKNFQRRRTGLHFDRVEAVRYCGIDLQRGAEVLSLLAIRFAPGDEPAGTIELLFSGDATIRLEVEYIEARLSDLGPAWSAEHKPRHGVG